MRKIVFVILTVWLTAGLSLPAAAQEHRRGSGKNEIRIGYGMLAAPGVVDSYSDIMADFAPESGIAYTDESRSGAFYLSYRRQLLPRIMLGVTLGYERVKKSYVFAMDGAPWMVGGKNDYLTVMADLQSRYLQVPSGILTLYWSVSIGAGFHKQKLSDFNYGPAKYDETRFAYQVTPLGMTLGLKRFGAFAEVGFGYKGIFQFGLYGRF